MNLFPGFYQCIRINKIIFFFKKKKHYKSFYIILNYDYFVVKKIDYGSPVINLVFVYLFQNSIFFYFCFVKKTNFKEGSGFLIGRL